MDGAFDYVIVGSGSAGSVLAERLGQDPRRRILVLEAGGSDLRFFVQMPLGYGKTFYDRRVNWAYQTEPDPGLAGQRDYWPRGRILGGSSSINAMVYIRGHASDYEDWKAAGNPGWGWDEVRAAYRAMEDNEAGADEWRGAGGPLFVSANRADTHPLVARYIAACEGVGLRHNPDFNGAEQEGAGIYQLTVRGGRRNSAARAFLHPAVRRGNVQVLTGAQATRVLWEGRRAVGVEYIRGGARQVASAADVGRHAAHAVVAQHRPDVVAERARPKAVEGPVRRLLVVAGPLRVDRVGVHVHKDGLRGGSRRLRRGGRGHGC
ncbi:MAG: GMC family oxidoreductase, partial [Gemmobacter sp.]